MSHFEFNNFDIKNGRCKKASLFFCSVKEKKFDSSLILSKKFCRFGYVQVIFCRPFSKKGKPFPTTFWLTCPYLIKLAGKIESDGGVKELENYIKINGLNKKWREYNFLHQVLKLKLINKNLTKFMRKYHGKIFKSLIRSGIGGMKYDNENIFVKCLHLQTASFLGLGFHPAEEWLKLKGLCGDCDKALCGYN